MKVIIAGSRKGIERRQVYSAIQWSPFFTVTEIVSGSARGVDTFGEEWAALNLRPIKQFPADWEAHGRAAGPIRNRQMAEYADALILVWDGVSVGSANMKRTMLALDKPVFEVVIAVRGVIDPLI